VERGVLQGDPASPLLFNICFNTLMQVLILPRYKQLGFSYGQKGHHRQRAWLQFADDSVIITPNTESAQALLNLFQAWCSWSGMTIRLDKCVVFGMKSAGSSYTQSAPFLTLQRGVIPVVPPDGDFHYLGKYFSFDSKHAKVKKALKDKLDNLLNITDGLSIRPQSKIKILNQYIHGQILFELKLYDLSAAWVDIHLDAACTSHIRDWLEMPPSACVKEATNVRRREGGLGVDTIQHLHQKMTILKRYSLKTSKSEEIRTLWAGSGTQCWNAAADDAIATSSTPLAASKSLKSANQKISLEHLTSLSSQGLITRSIIASISSRDVKTWVQSIEQMSACIFNFARKALLQILPTNSLLFLWKRAPSPLCPLCNSSFSQTNKHVLSNCNSVAALHRYTNRHNDVLIVILEWLRGVIPKTAHLYADLPDNPYLQVRDLFKNYRPDIAVVTAVNIFVLELTVCHESNFVKSHEYKCNKYINLQSDVTTLSDNRTVITNCIEVSTLGLTSDISDFLKLVSIPQMSPATKFRISKSVIDHSFQIYCNRNNNIIPI